MTVSIIAAIGKNRELGKDNRLPWRLSDDLKRFKALTRGHAVIMGRKTYQSIGRPLPERKNIVLAPEGFEAPGCAVVSSFEDALREAGDDPEIFVIGGAQAYAAALPRADRMYLTLVDAAPEADVFFPEFNGEDWKEVSSEEHPADDAHDHSFTFKTYERAR